MFKEYVCKFEGFGQTEELVFEIVDNELTRDWTSLVEYHFNKGQKYPRDLVNDYGENKEPLFNELKEIAQTIGLEYTDTFENYTQENLNRLHKEFHFKDEQNAHGEHKSLYHRLNILIHKMERNTPLVNWYTHNYIDKVIPVKDEHWKYFDVNNEEHHKRPTISLSYFTIGKDLRSCFYDNDVQLVKENGIRPIQRLHTQISYRRSLLLIDRKAEIRQWAIDNSIDHLIDWNDPSYRLNQRNPLLGHLRNDSTASKADMLWTYWTFKEIDIH